MYIYQTSVLVLVVLFFIYNFNLNKQSQSVLIFKGVHLDFFLNSAHFTYVDFLYFFVLEPF